MATKKVKRNYYFMVLLSVLDSTEGEVSDLIDATLSTRYKNRNTVFHGVYSREGTVFAEWTLHNEALRPHSRTQEFFTELADLMLRFERSNLGFATLQVNTRQA